jgi:hypothetical protein
MLNVDSLNMGKVTITGRELECDGRSYDVDTVIGLTLAKDCVAVTFKDGDMIKMDADATQFYAIGDQCPWAVKYIA